ncbi:hypothetical protein DMH04_03065 [Kibdelosporangium aridum]|uniref:Alpha/beta hydrolase n=1 Tax=Kibdelosporangium aridum TaxID=2030 RepID=A0A428ZQY2_KIBAR|nr:hypothetical protein [Kibdelosporangium aridum]RSM90462.1 hypothetical protein DMH04_03065 [Kibdelosporangium aridum]
MPESIVRQGPRNAVGTVLVLDPSGAASHGELPATWRELTNRWNVVWCRLPADDSASQLAEYMRGVEGPVDVVASGASSSAAMVLGDRYPDVIRSVLLVDPAAGEAPVDPATAKIADELWMRREADHVNALAEQGVQVRVIAHSFAGDRDRRDPPLPLGHPDVVKVLRAQLVSQSA